MTCGSGTSRSRSGARISVVGAALGPIVGGALLERFWWGSVFLINIPVVIAALILTPLVVPAGTRDRAKKWDAISSLYALLTLTGAVLAIKEAAHTPQNWAIVAGATVVAAIGGVLFTRRQLRSNDPPLDFGVFRNRAFSAGIITARPQCSPSAASNWSPRNASNSSTGSPHSKQDSSWPLSRSGVCPPGFSAARSCTGSGRASSSAEASPSPQSA